MATKNKFIGIDLEWAREQLKMWKEYVSENPYKDVQDRITFKETKAGGVLPIVVATKESQQKNQRDTMKDYLALLEVVDKLEQIEKKKEVQTRGDIDIPDIMRK